MNVEFSARCREFGEARLAVAREAKSADDWERLWKAPAHPFPFKWGSCWKHCVEYRVDDFPLELGFFLDILGFDSVALAADFAMLNNEEQEFHIAVRPAEGANATPPDSFRLQFLIDDICVTAGELQSRGVVFEAAPAPTEAGSPMYRGTFRTPHGVAVDLWGVVQETSGTSGTLGT